jgi:uncharacterized protein YndB with AHSA1/START domain
VKLVNAELDSHHTIVWIEWSTTAECGHLYWAFTEGMSDWLGDPSSMSTVIEPGAAFCIDARREWGGGAHYGRFVELHQDRRIAMKWIAESLGGVESDVVIELVPTAHGTDVSIAHAGVTDPAVRATVGSLWNGARHVLDSIIFSSRPHT